MTKAFSLVVFLLALATFAPAQATTVCQSTFTAGVGLYDMQYCVTENGNIAQMAMPHSYEHIGTGTAGEGYGICDISSGVEYADYAGGGATSNWLSPVITQPHGPNTFPLTVFRTTSDGLWQLRQTFSQDVVSRAIKIKMEIINQAAVAKDVNLLRFADIDANGRPDNLFQSTFYSEFASNFHEMGIQLRDGAKVGAWTFTQNVPSGPKPCDFTKNWATQAFTGNGSLELVYPLTVPKNGKKTVNVIYRPI